MKTHRSFPYTATWRTKLRSVSISPKETTIYSSWMASFYNWSIHSIAIRRIWATSHSPWVLQRYQPSWSSNFYLSLVSSRLQISCTIKSTPSRNRNIPIIVRVSDVNDNPPVFVNAPYETSIAEVSSIIDSSFFSTLHSPKQKSQHWLMLLAWKFAKW